MPKKGGLPEGQPMMLPLLAEVTVVELKEESLPSIGIGPDGKHNGGSPRTTKVTAKDISKMAENKGNKGGKAKPGAHLDRIDIGG